MNNAPEITLAEFVQKHGLGLSGKSVDSRPDGLMSDTPKGWRHFRVRISNGHKSFALYWSQGTGIDHPPTLTDVLNSLASDASGYENALPAVNTVAHGNQGVAFNNWASEYGYDTDSRAAEKIYKTIKRQANQLKRVLGNEAYQELLWSTERL